MSMKREKKNTHISQHLDLVMCNDLGGSQIRHQLSSIIAQTFLSPRHPAGAISM